MDQQFQTENQSIARSLSPAAKTFPRFRYLPPEIQNQIWSYAYQAPQIFIVDQKRAYDAYERLKAWIGVNRRSTLIRPYIDRCPVRAMTTGLLHACRDSRAFALQRKAAEKIRYPTDRFADVAKARFSKRLVSEIDFNPMRDTLLMTSPQALVDFVCCSIRRKWEIKSIRSVAIIIDFPPTNLPEKFYECIPKLVRLNSLQILMSEKNESYQRYQTLLKSLKGKNLLDPDLDKFLQQISYSPYASCLPLEEFPGFSS